MDLNIECERLLLTSLTLADMRRLKPGRQSFLKESVFTEVIKSAIAYKIEQMEKTPVQAHPWLNYWLITEKVRKEGIGLIGSKHLPDADGYVELGYALAAEYRRRGYMTEALEGFLDWLYEQPVCSGAALLIRSANLPSVRVAQKCGFRFERTEDIYQVYRYKFFEESC